MSKLGSPGIKYTNISDVCIPNTININIVTSYTNYTYNSKYSTIVENLQVFEKKFSKDTYKRFEIKNIIDQ